MRKSGAPEPCAVPGRGLAALKARLKVRPFARPGELPNRTPVVCVGNRSLGGNEWPIPPFK